MGQEFYRFEHLSILDNSSSGRVWADVGQMFRLANRRPNVCKSATQCLQICDLQHQKPARNLPRRLVTYLSGADLDRQAQWKLIWADAWAAVAGKLRADVAQVFWLQIGAPMFANRRPILDNKPCFQLFESVELSICNYVCKSLQLLFKDLQHQEYAQNMPETCPEDLSNICMKLI